MSVFIIVEAGVNHNGSLDMAKELVDVASSSGANAIKFQSFKAEKVATSSANQANYQKRIQAGLQDQVSMLSRLELSHSDYEELAYYCASKKIEFMSTPFDVGSVELLVKLGVKRFKFHLEN